MSETRIKSRAVLMVLLLGLPVLAQTPVKTAEEEARAAFERMAAAVWRPRDHGLREVRFSFELKVVHQDRPAEHHGPFRMHWHEERGWTLLDDEGQPRQQPGQVMNPTFAERVVNDFVGWNAASMIQDRKLSQPQPGLLVVAIEHEEPAEEARVESILLELDEDGALKRQSLIGTGQLLMNRMSYSYEEIAGRRLVTKTRSEAGASRSIKKTSYQEVAGFSFPAAIHTLSSNRRHDEIRYFDVEVLDPKEVK